MVDSVERKKLSIRNGVAISTFLALLLLDLIEVAILGHCLRSQPIAFSSQLLIVQRCELAWAIVDQKGAHRLGDCT